MYKDGLVCYISECKCIQFTFIHDEEKQHILRFEKLETP